MKRWVLILLTFILCQSCIVYTQKKINTKELPFKRMTKEQALQRVVEKRKRAKIKFIKGAKVTKRKYFLIRFDGESYYGLINDGSIVLKRDSLTNDEIILFDEIKKVKTINPGMSILTTVGGTFASWFGFWVVLTIASGGYNL